MKLYIKHNIKQHETKINIHNMCMIFMEYIK